MKGSAVKRHGRTCRGHDEIEVLHLNVIAGLDPAIHEATQQEKSVLRAYLESHHGCAGQARA